MASANFPLSNTSTPLRVSVDDRHGWGFALLLLLIATLFVRPADLIPALDKWPIYQFLILCCLVVGSRSAVRILTQQRLIRQPTTACMLVLLTAVAVSHLSHGFIWGARNSFYEISKLLVLYLLIVGLVNTPERFTIFIRWLTMSICLLASLALLDRLAIFSVAALESIRDRGVMVDGEDVLIERIRGTGIFQDPNDFGLILVSGLVLSTSFLTSPRPGIQRYLWLAPIALLFATLSLTHSRGALLSLICAIPAAIAHRSRGRFNAWPLLGLPILALAFSSRMTDVSALNEGTGQSRIQIWSDSLSIWRQYPLFGLGQGMLYEELGVVTHNSFLHCFAELGVLGGGAFLGCFLAAGLNLWSLRQHELQPNRSTAMAQLAERKAELLHHGSFIFAALVGYAAGMLTISRQFVPPTYVLIGLAATTPWLLNKDGIGWQLGNRFFSIVVLSTFASMVLFYLAVRLLVRW